MEVIIQPTAADAAKLTAQLLAERLDERPQMTLGLATGRTMERVYDFLAAMHTNQDLDFSLCHTFNLDEYVGVPATDPNSYRYYMNEQLFNRVNVDLRNTFLPDGCAPDLELECMEYEAQIDECNGVNLQLLGLGVSGHIGFNEPLSSFSSRTRAKALTPMTLDQNKEMFGGDMNNVPKRALTMGVGTILDAEEVIMLVTGKAKAEILAKAIEGPMTSMISASALQLHPNCKVIVDEEAAELLQAKDYYRWIFDNEPEWQPYHT